MRTRKTLLTCQVCGSEFYGDKNFKGCSKPCRAEWKRRQTDKANKKKHEATRARLGMFDCKHCGEKYEPRSSRDCYCSDACAYEVKKQKYKEWLVRSKQGTTRPPHQRKMNESPEKLRKAKIQLDQLHLARVAVANFKRLHYGQGK